MIESADVVVVGAGIHGASTAFHLARRGAKVAVLEARAAASGATGRSSGLVRMHYDLAAESALAWRSYDYFANWAERVGHGDCAFVRTGFLRIVPHDKEDALRANVADQLALGIDTRLITAAEAADIAPPLATDDFDIAAFEPQSGYADPTGACTGFLAGARAHGAAYAQGRPVEAIEVDGSRVTGIRTTGGRIATPLVVLAAGAWSGRLAASAGVEIEVRAWHHDTGYVTRPVGVGATLPTVIDDINECYFRPEGSGLALVGLEDGNRIDDRPDDDSPSDPAFIDHLVDRICRRVPAFVSAGYQGSHGGTDGISPDQRPILGRTDVDGLILQCGFSGTGFKIAPAVGLAISELVLDGAARSVDISIFDAGRFVAGRPLRGDHPYEALWR
jgi:sarcosine oxidase subunit beta